MRHYDPDDYLTSGKDVVCAWIVAITAITLVFTVLLR